MRSWPMLMLRGTTYYFRRTVPLSLRPLMDGKREIWKSLHTSDLDGPRSRDSWLRRPVARRTSRAPRLAMEHAHEVVNALDPAWSGEEKAAHPARGKFLPSG